MIKGKLYEVVGGEAYHCFPTGTVVKCVEADRLYAGSCKYRAVHPRAAGGILVEQWINNSDVKPAAPRQRFPKTALDTRVPVTHNVKLIKKLLAKRGGQLDDEKEGAYKCCWVVGEYALKRDKIFTYADCAVSGSDLIGEVWGQHVPEMKNAPINHYVAWGYVDGQFYGVQRALAYRYDLQGVHAGHNILRWRFDLKHSLGHIADTFVEAGHNVGWCKAQRRLLCFDWGNQRFNSESSRLMIVDGCIQLVDYDSWQPQNIHDVFMTARRRG